MQGARESCMKVMWEILVPTVSNEGKPFRKRYHKVWDRKVQEFSDGMTILTPAKGTWISPDKRIFEERMIPVRFIATKEEAEQIVDYTLKYYNQEAVLCYQISSEIIMRYKK